MSKCLARYIAFFLFVMFMTNIGLWSFSAARLNHEHEHSAKIEQAALAHHSAHSQAAEDGANEHAPVDAPSVAEHQILHAVDHPQLFPDTGLSGQFAPSMDSLILPRFTEQALPLPVFDLPFRPPRSPVLPA